MSPNMAGEDQITTNPTGTESVGVNPHVEGADGIPSEVRIPVAYPTQMKGRSTSPEAMADAVVPSVQGDLEDLPGVVGARNKAPVASVDLASVFITVQGSPKSADFWKQIYTSTGQLN